MHRLVKYALVVNLVLSLLLVISNFVLDNMLSGGHMVLWGSIWLTVFNAHAIGDIGVKYPNFPFFLFWILLVVNLFFILMMSREMMKNSQAKSELPTSK